MLRDRLLVGQERASPNFLYDTLSELKFRDSWAISNEHQEWSFPKQKRSGNLARGDAKVPRGLPRRCGRWFFGTGVNEVSAGAFGHSSWCVSNLTQIPERNAPSSHHAKPSLVANLRH